MAEIIPAIMPRDVADLTEKINHILGVADTVQIDVMDGVFVPPRTWPYGKQDMYFEAMLTGEQGLPEWERVNYEVDLMVADPVTEAEHWMQAGAARLIAHIESFKNEKEIETFLNFKSDFVEVALAIGIGTDIAKVLPYLDRIDALQCMGIVKIGYQGQSFDERVLKTIAEIHAKAPELIISVDGGVSYETAPKLIAAGVTRLVSGSVVFDADNPADAIRRLASS